MIEELFVLLALAGGVAASITDMRSGIIPNRLTFSLIAVGIFGYLAYGGLTGDLSMFLASLKSVAVMFAVGYLFWMLGAWSAGDAKEFLFIAALIPVYPVFLYETFNPAIAYYPFVISVFINTFLSIFPFIFLYSLHISLKKGLISRFIEPLKNPGKHLETSFVLAAAIGISELLGMRILMLLVLVLLYKTPRNYRIPLSALALLVYIFPLNPLWQSRATFISTYFAIVLLFIVAIRLLLNSMDILRKEALIEETKITALGEGMIVAEEIYIRDGEVLRDSKGMIHKIKDAAKTRTLDTFQRERIVGTGASGVTKEEIELLKEYVKKGKLDDGVKVKKSMPFAPVILAGLTISLLIGDAILVLKTWLYG